MRKTWYTKYLSAYEKPIETVPACTVAKVRALLAAKQSEKPIASVVLIAHNEGRRIFSCLWSLAENRTRHPIEIFVVDNNSTDDTAHVAEMLGVPCIRETKAGPGHARQCGLDHAKGRCYIAIDSDSLYPPDYIDLHVAALAREGVVCTYGLWSFLPDEKHSRLGLWWYELLRDSYLRFQNIKRPELCVRGMTMAFRTAEGRKVGFRTDIIRGEDGSMALGLKSFGRLRFITARKARIITDNATMKKDGSFTQSFLRRAGKAVKGAAGLFTSKRSYEDDQGNLLG